MSTRRTPIPRKPVAQKPVDVVVAPVAAAPPADAAAPEPVVAKKKPVTNIAGVHIAPSRTKHHFDKTAVNGTIMEALTPLKALAKPARRAAEILETGNVTIDGKPVPATAEQLAAERAIINNLPEPLEVIEEKIAALSSERVRFAADAQLVMSIIQEEICKDLIKNAMKNIRGGKRKIVLIDHLYGPGVRDCRLYPLVKELPLFADTLKQFEENNAANEFDQKLSLSLANAEREFRKKYQVQIKASRGKKAPAEPAAADAQPAEPVAADAQPVAAEEPAELPNKTTYKYYVDHICKDLNKSEGEQLSFSSGLKAHMSDLLIQFAHRMGPLTCHTASCLKNKTIDDNAILKTVFALLIDGHQPVETVVWGTKEVPDPALLKAAEEAWVADPAHKTTNGGPSALPKAQIDQIPRVNKLAATKTVTFPSSYYDEFAALIKKRVADYNAVKAADAKVKAETKAANAAAEAGAN